MWHFQLNHSTTAGYYSLSEDTLFQLFENNQMMLEEIH